LLTRCWQAVLAKTMEASNIMLFLILVVVVWYKCMLKVG
jgi:hypothetical protein